MARESETYEVRAFPRIRRAYTDVLTEGHRRHIIHGLVEVDVTRARASIRDRAVEGSLRLSFTGFLVACVGKAVDENRMLHAHRWGRRRLVLFDEVDVNLQLEQVDDDGSRIVQSRIIRAINWKTVGEISSEIREAQHVGETDRSRSGRRSLRWLRSWVRPRRRCASGFVRLNVTRAGAAAKQSRMPRRRSRDPSKGLLAQNC